ncbi:hypothetical protein WP5W18E06_13080 [Klebsiella quasipneumoniae]|nr:hypothetical protein WP5W18E06_13080 [Klebsiella quasipneumoniae]
MNPVIPFNTLFRARLKYRYFLLMEAVWAGIHRKLHTVVRYLCRIHECSTFHFVKRITFRLNLKVFELCNFSFERYGFFLERSCKLNERYAFALYRRKF